MDVHKKPPLAPPSSTDYCSGCLGFTVRAWTLGCPARGPNGQNGFFSFVLMRWGNTLVNEPKLRFCLLELSSSLLSCSNDHKVFFQENRAVTNHSCSDSSWEMQFLSLYVLWEKPPDKKLNFEICIALITAMVACRLPPLSFTFVYIHVWWS